ncbi:MAG: hypothetical protein KDD33_01525 [Bdellovibrionales bacterium]|nr:hypothetical protein [Bdellovibrionales bacterium]
MKRLITFLIIIILGSTASAAVNMKNGSYTDRWIDLIAPGSGYDFRIERHYSSRSLFIGLFGFGWCSQLETKLEVQSDGSLILSECGGGIEVSYYPTQFDKKSVNQTIDQIIQYLKKGNKDLSKSYLRKLRTQLVSDHRQRFLLATQFHLVDFKKAKANNSEYVSRALGVEKIRLSNKTFTRQRNDGVVETFDLDGQLTKVTDRMGQWIKLQYKGSLLSIIVDNKGRKLNFLYSKQGKLSQITDGKGLSVTYQFTGENLTSVTNAWKNTYIYKYDKNHNLEMVTFPDKSFMKMSYDVQRDWIKSYTDRTNCTERYDFILSRDDPKNHYWSTLDKSCKEVQTVKAKFEFWYKAFSHAREKYLNRLLEVVDTHFKDIYFHPYLGKQVSVREDNVYQGFAYLTNGLINETEVKKYSGKNELTDWKKIEYKYKLPNTAIVESVANVLNPKTNKVLLTTKTKFTYNNRNLLSRATQANGVFVDVKYNSKGQISVLSDHKNIKISLGYDNVNSMPTIISQPGLGEAKIVYNDRGEVIDIRSNKGRNIASSVVQTFLSFVDIIGPGASLTKF